MHLVLIISSLNAGGAERVLSNLANYWTSQGHEVSLITWASECPPFYPLNPNITLLKLPQGQNHAGFFARLKSILRRIFYLRKTLLRLKPQAIISFVDITNITTLIAAMGFKIPIIVSERIDPSFYKLPSFYTWLRLKIYPSCCKLVVQTENAANYFPKDFRKFMKVIPNPVNQPPKVQNQLEEKVHSLITLGRLELQKGHDILIQAFSRLTNDYPDLHLTIYGEGKERARLEQLIHDLDLEKKIFLPGTITNIIEALLKADLFIFPSQFEGFPNALVEAMAAGLPIIASNCSGNVEIVRDGIDGRLFPVGDIDKLTQLTRELLEDPIQRKRLAQQAQNVCNRFHPQAIYKMWDEIITSLK